MVISHIKIMLWIEILIKKKGVPSAVGFPHCAGSGEGLSLSPKPYPHKCAEAGARTRDLPVTDEFGVDTKFTHKFVPLVTPCP